MGTFLRNVIPTGHGLKDVEFASCVVTYFMQIVGILQLPAFLGPDWNPFSMFAVLSSLFAGSKRGGDFTKEIEQDEDEAPVTTDNGKSNKSKQKKKGQSKVKNN